MTGMELIHEIRNSDNWTDAFFSEIEPYYLQNLNLIRNTLAADGVWDRFDTAFSEWKRPGQ